MKQRGLIALVVLLAACAGPEAPWLGEWAVTGVETHRPCGGGAATDYAVDTTWTIEANGAGIAIAGPCRIGIIVDSTTSARTRPYSCSTVIDGHRVDVAGLDGSLMREGDRLTASIAFQVTIDGSECRSVSSELRGVRR